MPLLGSFGAASSKGFGQTRAGGRQPYVIEYMVAAGGAGGSAISGGSGGAGGLTVFSAVEVDPEATFAVTVGGAGSTGSNSRGGDGSSSAFGPSSTVGGGSGGRESPRNGSPGGSGGAATIFGGSAGSGTGGQGNPGGPGGGGGKNGSGGPGVGGGPASGGGASFPYPVTGNNYSGGGNYNDSNIQNQPANSGNGGPGRGQAGTAGAGGSGIVIVSYDGTEQLGIGGSVSTRAGKTIHTFNGPGTYIA